MWIDEFGDVVRFQDVKHIRSVRALVADRADLSHAMMINDTSPAPERLDLRANTRDTPAWLPSHKDLLNLGSGEIDLFFLCDFCQAQSVSRSAAEHRDAIVHHHRQACSTAQAATGDTQAAQAGCRFKCCPEPQEWRKGESKKQTVLIR